MILKRLRVVLEPKAHMDGVVVLRVRVDQTDDSLNYEVVIPDDDFMTRFDYAWKRAKNELDKFIEQNREEK